MRKISIFVSIFLLLAISSVGVSAQKTTRRALKPAVVDSSEVRSALVQAQQYVASYKAARAANKAAASGAMASPSAETVASTSPKFIVRVTGDLSTGIYATARSANTIPRGSIYFGSRTDASGNTIYLRPFVAEEDYEAGWVWIDLENGKKSVWDEPSGTMFFQVFVFSAGQMQVTTAEKEFLTGFSSPQFISKGESTTTQNGNTHFVFKGYFGSAVGVGTIKNIDNEYEVTIPPDAVRLVNPTKVVIDFAKVPYYNLDYGDYLVTITDGYGMSNTVTVRHAPDLGGTGKSRPDLN